MRRQIIYPLFFLSFFIINNLFGIEASPKNGGGVLIIDNQTDFAIKFPEGVTTLCQSTACYLKNSLSMSSVLNFDSVPARSVRELELSWMGLSYWFGAPEQANGRLVISSDEWGQDFEIVLKKRRTGGLEKVDVHQEDAFDPLKEVDRKMGLGMTPRIFWMADWDVGKGGWKITLVQKEVDTGVLRLDELEFILSEKDFDEL